MGTCPVTYAESIASIAKAMALAECPYDDRTLQINWVKRYWEGHLPTAKIAYAEAAKAMKAALDRIPVGRGVADPSPWNNGAGTVKDAVLDLIESAIQEAK